MPDRDRKSAHRLFGGSVWGGFVAPQAGTHYDGEHMANAVRKARDQHFNLLRQQKYGKKEDPRD